MDDIKIDSINHKYFVDGLRYRVPSQSEVSSMVFGNKIPDNAASKQAIITGSNCHTYIQYYLLHGLDPVYEMSVDERKYYDIFKLWWKGSQYYQSWKNGNVQTEVKRKMMVSGYEFPVMCGTLDIVCNSNKNIIDLKFGAMDNVKHLVQGICYTQMMPEGYKFYNLYIHKKYKEPKFIFRDTNDYEARKLLNVMICQANVLNFQIQNDIIK